MENVTLFGVKPLNEQAVSFPALFLPLSEESAYRLNLGGPFAFY